MSFPIFCSLNSIFWRFSRLICCFSEKNIELPIWFRPYFQAFSQGVLQMCQFNFLATNSFFGLAQFRDNHIWNCSCNISALGVVVMALVMSVDKVAEFPRVVIGLRDRIILTHASKRQKLFPKIYFNGIKRKLNVSMTQALFCDVITQISSGDAYPGVARWRHQCLVTILFTSWRHGAFFRNCVELLV